MKTSYKVLVLFLGLCLIPLCADTIKSVVSGDANNNAGDKKVKTYSNNFPYQAATPINIHADGFSLVADSGSLLHDLDISVAFIPYKGGTPFPSDMENVTGVCEGVRLLPNGEHFSETNPARITLSYNPDRLPMGYEPNEIYTYYCDDEAHWHRLHRVEVDTVAHTVTSLTTHFTDFANAVIKVPEMPESKAFVPTMMTDLPDPDPMKGVPMIVAPTPNNRGTAELTYPIELPKGRNGLQPNVDLHYSSANAGSNGILGPGWSINFPAITIDTRWGVPRYDLNYETEQYLVNGEPVLFRDEEGMALNLPSQTNSFMYHREKGDVRFYARDVKNADRIIRHGDDPKKYWWEVTDRNGITTYYGRKFDPKKPEDNSIDENSVVRTNSIKNDKSIAYWAATATVDVYGNYILYTNYKEGNCIYVKKIDYTGNYKQSLQPLSSIIFQYKKYNDILTSSRLGVLQSKDSKLYNIYISNFVEDKKFELARHDPNNVRVPIITYSYKAEPIKLCSYVLNYSEPEEKNLFKCRLLSISKQVQAGTSHNTSFSYADAPSAGTIFSTPDIIAIPTDKNISASESQSWSLGGTATVGVGPDIATTFVSGGGNYDYGRSEGKCTSMLMDLNGDGLKDIVYEENDKVYYCRQIKQGNKYSFDNARRIPGLSRLSHEVTETNTWGLQLSFGADLYYTNPISKSVIDAYFADVNADGLPDFIDGVEIKFNYLDSIGNPSFEPLRSEQDYIAMHNSSTNCNDDSAISGGNNNDYSNIVLDGEVDEHIDCELREIPLGMLSLEEFEYYAQSAPLFPPRRADPGEVWSKEELEAFELYQQFGWLQEPMAEPRRRYRAVGDSVYLYELEYVCDTTRVDPDIENVRVWVAPDSGRVFLNDTICLLQDRSESRQRSHTVDGVSYSIQHCRNVTEQADKMHLHAENYTILFGEGIDAEDHYEHIWDNYPNGILVRKGDVIMFRLRSRENNRYDKTRWKHTIQFIPSTYPSREIFDSEKDYICTGDNFFKALYDGEVSVSLTQCRNDGDYTPIVEVSQVRQYDKTKDTVVSTTIIPVNKGQNNPSPITCQVQKGDEIHIQLKRFRTNDPEPCWSDVHVSPCLQYISDFPIDTMGNTTRDTVTYYPDVQIENYSSFYSDKESPYRQLFGTLHKGWGQFAYQNIGNQDIILLDSLVNTQQEAAGRAMKDGDDLKNYDPNISFSKDDEALDEETILAQVNSAFSYDALYNPVAKNNYWIPMNADSRTEQYIAYGNMGCIGKSIHSNERETSYIDAEKASNGKARKAASANSNANSSDEIIAYDSPLPYQPGQGMNNFVFKSSKSKQNSISWGAFVINESVSFGTYESLVDYMDLNGDGFPDVLGKGGIQYTRPWGGLDKLDLVENYSQFMSSNLAGGRAFSANPAQLAKITGNNIRDGKFAMSPSLGVNANGGTSSTRVTYMDMNADGLADKVDLDKDSVYYNLGYGFSNPKSFIGNVLEGSNACVGASIGLSGGASWTKYLDKVPHSIAQVSISGGFGGSRSTNITKEQLIDINGDGLPDIITKTGQGVQVEFLKSDGTFAQGVSINGLSTGKDVTDNISTTLGVTAGFSWAIVKLNVGVQSSPYSMSISHGESMLTDMNGDGLVDYVYKDGNKLYVRYNQAGKANLLDTVTNPTGQKIVLDYTLSEPTSAHMSRQWNLSRVENLAEKHPMPEMRKSVTSIEYAEPYYDNYERTDYGYKYVRSIQNGEKYYHAVYNNWSFLQQGELIADSLMDSLGNVYICHKHEVRYKNVYGENTCDDIIMLTEKEDGYWTDYYEGQSEPQISTRYTIKYDKYHNIIEYADYGDVETPSDDWRQKIAYVQNAANNMVSLPRAEEVYDISTRKLLRSSSVEYSNLGKPTEVSLKLNGPYAATTNLEYDEFGNVTKIIGPENDNGERYWSKYEYDQWAHTHIISIDNPFHAITKTEYDYKWGLPKIVTDPAGNEIRYTYDQLGRVSSVTAPDDVVWDKKTILYEYKDADYGMVVLKNAPSANLRETSLFDQYGKLMQKKHYAEVEGEDQWVVDKAEDWDKYGRPISSAFPFVAKKSETEYEPFGNGLAIITKYDLMDRPTSQTNPDETEKGIAYGFKEDAEGLLRFATSVTDENGNVTETLKSPQDWTIQQIAGDGSKTNFAYSPIGELLEVVDADGYKTTYEYDRLGRTTKRIHPDAGETKWEYDLAGNLISKQTYRLFSKNEEIQYTYKYGRLQDIHYPYHKDNDVHFYYDNAGRIAMRTDGTGSEEFSYDRMGNLAQSLRRIVVPSENNAYVFEMQYEYDSFGRMRSITYPDGEVVKYNYTTGGLLKNVMGNSVYIEDRLYDEQGRKTFQYNGNRTSTRYEYDPERQWLRSVYTESTNTGDVLQDLTYDYDYVGNITRVTQHAPGLKENFGGEYENTYEYDEQYRLVHSEGDGDFPYYFESNFSPAGRMGNKKTDTYKWLDAITFGYDKETHHPRTFFEPEHGGMDLYWDLNGNLAQMVSKSTNSARLHEWDEENRLRFVLGEKYAGFYGYDGNGERVYKLTGTSSIDQQNFGVAYATATFDNLVLYPNPYIVVTKKGYTKHYYAGSERIAAVMGTGGFEAMVAPIEPLDQQRDGEVKDAFYYNYQSHDPFHTESIISGRERTENIEGQRISELEYQSEPIVLDYVDILNREDMLYRSVGSNEQANSDENKAYFYHGDHLGSANWITDADARIIHNYQYTPFGELIIDNSWYRGYDERYKFTGKERDGETGYDFFGARYWWAPGGHWLSVDPLADKYPGISPYAYCSWDPVNKIDPDGMEEWSLDVSTGKFQNIGNKGGSTIDYYSVGTYEGDEFSSYSNYEIERGEGSINSFRIQETDKSTMSAFHIPETNTSGFILERPGPDTSESGQSLRIPAGQYGLHANQASGYPDVPRLYLPNEGINGKFDKRGILIHVGNYPENSQGCLLPGSSWAKDFVGNSGKTLPKITNYCVSKNWMVKLNIFNAFK